MPLILLTTFSYFIAFIVIFALGGRKNAYANKVVLTASGISLAAFLALLMNPFWQGEYIFATYHMSGFTFDFGFLADKLSLLMGGVVSFVTTLVLLYSCDYMREDAERGRFMALLCFFAGSMLGIVYSVSFAQLFIFWELVGLSSYFLIGFWWRDPVVASSSRKVFTTIVIGDVFLLSGFLVLGSAFGTFTFSEIIREHIHVAFPAAGVFLVLLGAFTKSAQIPFSLWLPWAMEGPTPVSALLHSATMVKAGVFLIARILPLVFAAQLTGFVIVFALLTIFIASLLALVEKDIKRILAYSTISQLGFIAFGLGLGAYGASLFHLFNDAFYKALLFLGAGVIIHAGGSRNIFELKPLHWTKEKVFLVLTIVGALGISGLPPFNGFFSKELILEAAKESHNPVLFYLALCSAFLSALYISRWVFFIFKKIEYSSSEVEKSSDHSVTPPLSHSSTFGWSTKIPMGVLGLGVILTGWMGTLFFSWLGVEEKPHYLLHDGLLSVLLILGAFFISYVFCIQEYFSTQALARLFSPVRWVVDRKFGIIWFYDLLARFLWALGDALHVFDRYIIDTILWSAAMTGRGVAGFAAKFDSWVIDGFLHSMAKGTIALCFGSAKFDWFAIDGLVRSFNSMLSYSGNAVRKLVTGSAITYTTALVIAAIFSILLLNGVLAK